MATCVGEGVQGASVGWDGADRVEIQGVLAEKLGAFVGVQFEVASGPGAALACNLASSDGAAGEHSPVESGSLGVSAAGAESHFVDVAAADLGMPAGTGGGHQADGAYIHVGRLAGSGEVVEVQEEQPLVQAGTPEAVSVQWAEGTAAAVSAAVAEVQEFGLGLEWASLAGAYIGDRPPSVGVQCILLRLQEGQDDVVLVHSWE